MLGSDLGLHPPPFPALWEGDKNKIQKSLDGSKPDEKLEVDENQEANKSRKDDCVERRVDEGAVNCREDVEAYGENTGRFGSERTEMKLFVLNVLSKVAI